MYSISLRSAGGSGYKENDIVKVDFSMNNPDFVLTVGKKEYRFSVVDDDLVLAAFDFKNLRPVMDYNGNVSIRIYK